MKASILPLLFGLAACDPLLSFNWQFTDPPPEGSPNMTYRIGPLYNWYDSLVAYTYHFGFTDSVNERGSISLRPEKDNCDRRMMHAVFRAHNAPGITTDDTNCHVDDDGVICNHNIYLHEDWPNYNTMFDLNVRKVGENKWIGTVLDLKTNLEHQIGSWTLQRNAGNIRLDGNGGRAYIENVGITCCSENCANFPPFVLFFEGPAMNPGDSVRATLDYFQEGPCCYEQKDLKVGFIPHHNYFILMGNLDAIPRTVQDQLDQLSKSDAQEISVA